MDEKLILKPIPNFLAKETHPKLLEEILRDHPAVGEALLRFRAYLLPSCIKRITISKMTEDLIEYYCGNQEISRWYQEGLKTNIIGQVFFVGGSEKKGRDSIILDSTKRFKVSSSANQYNMVRNRISYEGTASKSEKKITSILVVYAVEWIGGNDQIVESEVIATLYLLPYDGWLEKVRLRGRYSYLLKL